MRVDAEYIRGKENRDEREKSIQKPRAFGAVGGIYKGQREPRTADYFNDDAECEILARDEREKQRFRNIQDDEWKEENAGKANIPERLFE